MANQGYDVVVDVDAEVSRTRLTIDRCSRFYCVILLSLYDDCGISILIDCFVI